MVEPVEPTPICGSNLVISDDGIWTVDECAHRVTGLDGFMADESPCALVGTAALDLVSAACALAATLREGIVLPRERLTPTVRKVFEERGFAYVDLSTEAPWVSGRSQGVPGRIHILTSGSTGAPKLLRHTWKSLFTMTRLRQPRPSRWLLTYQAGTYAWYQLVTALLYLSGHSLVIPEDTTPSRMIAAAASHRVTAISATPTFWRLALLQADPDDLDRLKGSLESLTLGGEPVDQAILDTLKRLFPAVRLVHIYASSEAGASIVVTDGQAGFPAEWLEDENRSTRLKVVDGTLRLLPSNAAAGITGWYDSGDVAEVRSGRVHLLGRLEAGVISVGGAKAFAADIERVILEHPEVRWCHVRGVRAPIVGQLIQAAVVRQSKREDSLFEAELTRHCAERLPTHMVPRIWVWPKQIPATMNWKTEA